MGLSQTSPIPRSPDGDNNGTTFIIIESSLSELDKMWSRLATQFFNFLWVVAREQHLWQALKNEMQSNIH